MRLFKLNTTALLGFVLALFCISTSSCDLLHEDLQPCVSGARLRFVYDYNMEDANAFPSQVDCLTVLVYDASGRYVRTMTAGRPDTADEDWRMDIDLPQGSYHLIAYGGLDCSDASFKFVKNPEEIPYQDLQVSLKQEEITSPVGQPLHHLYFGDLDIDIPAPGTVNSLIEETVYMMKDTNDIRVMLASANDEPVNEKDFNFYIISDNTLMNYENKLLPTSETTYCAWSKENVEIGLTSDYEPQQMACAEISTSRFVLGNPTTLLITRTDGSEVVKIPLLNLLKHYKSDRFADMPPQEYLDRESRWTITFILTGDGSWLKTRIVVNDWIVRINNIDEL